MDISYKPYGNKLYAICHMDISFVLLIIYDLQIGFAIWASYAFGCSAIWIDSIKMC
jgi:hypothetical protein